jgi:hypothetical protein
VSRQELERLQVLSRIRIHVGLLRPQLEAAGAEEWFHLDETERLVTELMAAPAAVDFQVKVDSMQWHLKFLYAEYEQLKGRLR